jgi:outer membrane protein assembly factor BamB
MRRKRNSIVVGMALAAGLSLASLATARGENWPQFRGPTGQGHSAESGLALSWGGPGNENVRWQVPLVGQGHASPIVWDGRVIVCTARWPEGVADKAAVIPEQHVTCYDADDGRLLWDTLVPPGGWLRGDGAGPGGGYAAPTPATDGRLIYAVFGSAVMAALDFSGEIVWRAPIEPYTFDVTLSTSPVVFRDTVILLSATANAADARVIAFDAPTGAVRWTAGQPTAGFSHATPLLVREGGREQLLLVGSGRRVADDALVSIDPASGRRLWWCRGAGEAASAACGAGVVYFDSGRGGMGVAVDPTGTGDVTATHVRWTIDQVPEAIGSPIIVGPYVYRLHAPAVLKCWEARSGALVYAERLDGLFTTWASPVADAEGNLYLASAGKSFVVRAGKEFEVLAENDLGDGNHASPAVSGGRMYLVGLDKLHCVGR